MRQLPSSVRKLPVAPPPESSGASPDEPIKALEQALRARVGWLDGLVSPFARSPAAPFDTVRR